MNEGHVLDQLADYVLGNLAGYEQRAVEQHLGACPICRAEWLALQETAGMLALASPPVEPPARLKQSILYRVTPRRAYPAERGREWFERARSWLASASPAWAAVSLVLILALAAGNLFLWQQVSQSPSQKVAQMRTIAMTGSDSQPQANGLLVITGNGRSGTLVVDRLPALDPQHQYQLWLVQDGQRTNGGVFSVDSDGYGALVIESIQPLTTFQNFSVTIEPAGGSLGPTGEKVLSGHL